MLKNKAKQIVKKYSQKLTEANYPFSAIYLYGSYANGNAHKWSDIDVAVVSDKLKRNWWRNKTLLSHISLDVDSRIEPHGFTVNDFADDCDPMVYEIKRTGIRVV